MELILLKICEIIEIITEKWRCSRKVMIYFAHDLGKLRLLYRPEVLLEVVAEPDDRKIYEVYRVNSIDYQYQNFMVFWNYSKTREYQKFYCLRRFGTSRRAR